MRSPSWLALFGLSAIALIATPAAAQKVGDGNKQKKIISPAALGPAYSGITGAGVGLGEREAAFGVKAGDFVIQPRLFIEAAYTTNFFRVDERTNSSVSGSAEKTGVFLMRLRPGVGMYNPKFTKVAFNLALDADVFLPLTGGDAATSQTSVGGVASAQVSFFPKGILTFTLDEQFKRELWTRSTAITGNANRNANRLGGDLSFHPGGGALDFTLGYRWSIVRYDDIEELNTDSHDVRFLASWRFYPLTYLFLESTLKVTDYPDAPGEATGQIGNYLPGLPFKVYLGLSGYFTERIAILARVGYGNSLLDTDTSESDFNSVIAMLQVTFRFGPKTVLHVGAARDFEMVALGGTRSFVRGYLSFEQKIGDLALLHIDGAFDWRLYGAWVPYPYTVADPAGDVTVTPTPSDTERSDFRIRAGVLVDFDIHRIFGVTVGYRLNWVLSDYNLVVNLPTSTQTQFLGYDEHRIFVSLNLRY